MTRRLLMRRPRTTAERRAAAAALVPRPTTRDARGVSFIHMAEYELQGMAYEMTWRHAEPPIPWRATVRWGAMRVCEWLDGAGGPRSVRTRVRRLRRKVARMLAQAGPPVEGESW